MPSFTLLPVEVGATGAFISGTSSFGIFANGAPGQILYDDSDETFYGISSSSAFDPSLGCQFPQTLLDTLPRNVGNLIVTLVTRLRVNTVSPGGCPVEDVPPTTEIWVELEGDESEYATVQLSASFTDVSTVLEVMPNGGDWDVTTIPRAFYGLRARADCPSGALPLRVNWSQARMRLDFTLPVPVLTLRSPVDLAAYGVTLRAFVNPNQDGAGLVGPPDGYPVEWEFEIGLTPTTLVPSTFQGSLISNGDIPVETLFSGLVPGTTYFYRIAARVDGVTSYSETTSVTLPLNDPPQGVY